MVLGVFTPVLAKHLKSFSPVIVFLGAWTAMNDAADRFGKRMFLEHRQWWRLKYHTIDREGDRPSTCTASGKTKMVAALVIYHDGLHIAGPAFDDPNLSL